MYNLNVGNTYINKSHKGEYMKEYILVCYKDDKMKRVIPYSTLGAAKKALQELAKDYTSGKIFVEYKEGKNE